jgi:ion channel
MMTAAGCERTMTAMVGTPLGEDRLGNPQAPDADEPILRLESRVARLRASHSYGLVLLVVISSLVFAALVPDGAWLQSALVLLLAALLIVALWTSGVARLRSYPVVILLAIAGAAALSPIATGGRTLEGALSLIDAALVAAAIAAIGLGAIDQQDVNRQSLRAAIGAYLLLGMFFVFVYGAVAVFGSGPFFEQGTDGTTAERFYFSFVTLATLGYGDYTVSGDFGHLLAVFEALFGQLYLVTVLALLVGALGRKRLAAPGE